MDKTYMDVEDLKVYQRLCKLHNVSAGQTAWRNYWRNTCRSQSADGQHSEDHPF